MSQDKPHILQVMVPLPEREDAAVRMATLSADVREALELARKRLEEAASARRVNGWVADEDGEYAVINRTVIGRLRITRP